MPKVFSKLSLIWSFFFIKRHKNGRLETDRGGKKCKWSHCADDIYSASAQAVCVIYTPHILVFGSAPSVHLQGSVHNQGIHRKSLSSVLPPQTFSDDSPANLEVHLYKAKRDLQVFGYWTAPLHLPPSSPALPMLSSIAKASDLSVACAVLCCALALPMGVEVIRLSLALALYTSYSFPPCFQLELISIHSHSSLIVDDGKTISDSDSGVHVQLICSTI